MVVPPAVVPYTHTDTIRIKSLCRYTVYCMTGKVMGNAEVGSNQTSYTCYETFITENCDNETFLGIQKLKQQSTVMFHSIGS